MQSYDTSTDDCDREGVPEEPAKNNQWNLWLSDFPVEEKSGYVEFCPFILWKIMVEDWMGHDAFGGDRHASGNREK